MRLVATGIMGYVYHLSTVQIKKDVRVTSNIIYIQNIRTLFASNGILHSETEHIAGGRLFLPSRGISRYNLEIVHRQRERKKGGDASR